MKRNRLALIAGDGSLPVLLAKRIISENLLSLVIVLQGSKERFDFAGNMVHESSPGKVGTIIKLLKSNEINKMIMIGKIDKTAFIERKGFDFKALQLIKKIKDGNDMSIFNIIQKELDKIGIEIVQQDLYLKDMIVQKGLLTKRKPNRSEMGDAEFGIKYARQLASMDIGQAVIVKDKVITAVEAVEGTNNTIKRGALHGKTGFVVCKAARSNQDPRFDIPSIGMTTLEIMADNNCTLLALEAGKIFIMNPEEVIAYANSKKISIMGL